MHRRSRRFATAALGATALGLGGAGQATAVVTSSQVTSPADPAFRTYDADAGPNAPVNRLVVTGRAVSDSTISDRVDLRCFWTDSGGELHANSVALRVPLEADGSFSAEADPKALSDNPFGDTPADDASGVQTCQLRAVPTVSDLGQVDTGRLPDFAGPRVNVARFGSSSLPVRGGGVVTVDFSVGVGGLRGQAEWGSAGSCGPYAFRPFVNPVSFTPALFPNWDCVAAVLPPTATSLGSQLVVDGRDAFTASNAPAFDFDTDGTVERPQGAAGLGVGYRRDPASGAVSTAESSAVQRCDQPAFPPTATSCRTLVDTGVQFERTTTLGDDGLEATVTDVLRSTDGAAHAVDLQLQQYVVFDNDPVFRFPGEPGFAPFGPGTQPPLGGPGPSTVLTRDAVTPGTPRQGTGAETWSSRPDDVRFFGTDYQYAERYARTVPAGGAVTLVHVFRTGRSELEVALGARGAEDRLAGPGVVVTAPADGSTTSSSQVTVTGRVSDSVEVAGLTVGGRDAAVAADGTFAQKLTLAPGANVIAAEARDGAGNTSQAVITVTYAAPAVCVVPRLSRNSLYGTARSKLKRAGCRVGTVKRVRAWVRKGRVVRTSPAGGKRVARGTKVRIELSDGKAKRPRRTAKRRSAAVRPATAQRVQVAARPAAVQENARAGSRAVRGR